MMPELIYPDQSGEMKHTLRYAGWFVLVLGGLGLVVACNIPLCGAVRSLQRETILSDRIP
jgi:hypothetical protein